MNKITMYDMGFGDAHILEKDIDENGVSEYNEKLLVDCGSKNARKASAVVLASCTQISNSLQNSRASFLLTHFHSDHYNQLKNLKNVFFDRIYVSNIYSSIPTVYMTIYKLLIYKKHSFYWNEAYNTLKIVPELRTMLNKNGLYYFIREGSNIYLNGENYEVFSPKSIGTKVDFFEFKDVAIKELVDKIAYIIMDIGVSIDNVLEYDNNIPRLYLYDDNVEYLPSLLNVEQYDSTFKDRIENNLADIFRLLNETDIELSLDEKKALRNKIRKMKKHETNIVFGLRKDNNQPNFRLLMCGDSEIKDLANIVSKYNIKNVDVIKVPHHGTPAHASTFGLESVHHALIPYSYPANSCGRYIISSIYSSTPYTNNHIPKDIEKY